YDIISPQEQRALHARSPYNVVRLEYGESRQDDREDDNRYTRAASTLADWLAAGILVADEQPSFYVYDQEFQHAGRQYRRRCLLARVRLEEWAKGAIRPHEHTLPLPKKDRLRLLRACRANLSPVFALYRDHDQAIGRALAQAIAASNPTAVAQKSGETHTLWAIADEQAQRWLREQFAPLNLYIADGHHRYETALAYRDERRAAATTWTGEEPESFALLGLTAADDPGLLVLPIHRLARLSLSEDEVLQRLRRYVSVEEVATEGASDEAAVQRLLDLMAERGQTATAFGLCGPDERRLFLLTLDDAEGLVRRLCPDCPAAWRDLDVAVLDLAVLGMILRIDPEPIEEGGCVAFIDDPGQAWHEVRAGRYSAAFLVNPVRVEQILALADAGRRMPRKSTFFHPKLATGLVINRLDH
ncbi:MAG: DUF1015 domain-containing protein, partial [Chloroflexota bacterium]|nr:DUF1015 domain-containing protein [Chloroflexota bacterium]